MLQSSFRPIFAYTLQITVVTTEANNITHAEEEVLKAYSGLLTECLLNT